MSHKPSTNKDVYEPGSSPDNTQWWDALTSHPDIGVAVIDVEGTTRYANPVFAAAFALSRTPSNIPCPLDSFIDSEVAAEIIQLIKQTTKDNPRVFHTVLNGVGVRGMLKSVVIPECSREEDDPDQGVLLLVIRTLLDEESPSQVGLDEIQLAHADLGKLNELTDRELQILALIGQGLTTAEIAKQLYRSAKTVEWYRSAIGEKLKATNRVELARVAIKADLIRRFFPDFCIEDAKRDASDTDGRRTRDRDAAE